MESTRWSLVAAAVCLAAAAAGAQQAAKPAEGKEPRIAVPEGSFNFGYVPEGATVSHGFWLKNVGGDTLRITDVRPG